MLQQILFPLNNKKIVSKQPKNCSQIKPKHGRPWIPSFFKFHLMISWTFIEILGAFSIHFLVSFGYLAKVVWHILEYWQCKWNFGAFGYHFVLVRFTLQLSRFFSYFPNRSINFVFCSLLEWNTRHNMSPRKINV